MRRIALAACLTSACLSGNNPGFDLLETTASGATTGPVVTTTTDIPASTTDLATTTGDDATGTATSSTTPADPTTTDATTGAPPECLPSDEQQVCYTGPLGTLEVGTCHDGLTSCNDDGTDGPCVDEVVPQPEDCATFEDENCDGVVNEGCEPPCVPTTLRPCYTGPDGTEGVGACKIGFSTCTMDQTWGPCFGDTVPMPENCDNNTPDDDCDGTDECP